MRHKPYTEIEIYREVGGEELRVVVTGQVTITKPDPTSWDSDLDYHGHQEIDDIAAHIGGAPVELTAAEMAQAEEELLAAYVAEGEP